MKKYNNVNLVLSFIILLITIVSLWFLPDQVPTHTHLNTVDGWGSKYMNLIGPVLAFVQWYFMPVFMASKVENAKLLGTMEGPAYLSKSKYMINLIFIIFTYLDLYWIYQDFQYTSPHVSLHSVLLIAIAILYFTLSSAIYFMSEEELLQLHWKEFRQGDTRSTIKKKKSIFAISGCIVGLLLLGDALWYTISIPIIVIVTALLLLKFLIGLFRKKNRSHIY